MGDIIITDSEKRTYKVLAIVGIVVLFWNVEYLEIYFTFVIFFVVPGLVASARYETFQPYLMSDDIKLVESKLIQDNKYYDEPIVIDITKDFKVNVPEIEYGRAVFTVAQDDKLMAFSSDAPNAQYIVTKALKYEIEWPPQRYWNFGW